MFMRGLIIGLGSMGKRRIRNLSKIPGIELFGFDIRLDRVESAQTTFAIPCSSDYEYALKNFTPDFLIISTPPGAHLRYMNSALENKLDCFIEASVVHQSELIQISNKTDNLIFSPSCTMSYFPGPKLLKQLMSDNVIGDVVNINYHVGQYLPDWHPWESIHDFYVSTRETGGAREIVPFELTWLVKIFGNIKPLACVRGAVGNLDVDIDDVYHCIFRLPQGILNMTIEVLSRPRATREMKIIGTRGLITLSGDLGTLTVETIDDNSPKVYSIKSSSVEPGYIYSEEPYEEEMQDFISALSNRNELRFPNSLKQDADILKILIELEDLSLVYSV